MDPLGTQPPMTAPPACDDSVTTAQPPADQPLVGYVINLRHREDRWAKIQAQFREVKSIQLERFEALEGRPGWIYCGKSHLAAIAAAKARNLPYVLILEDDATVEDAPGFDARFARILQWLKRNPDKWDAFSGGQNLPPDRPDFEPLEIVDKKLRLLRLGSFWCAHFTLYPSRSYDKMLEWGISRKIENQVRDSIDVYISDNFRVITTVPYLSIQDVGMSDIMGGTQDYTALLRRSETRAIAFFSAGLL